MKQCYKCKKILPLDEYYKNRAKPDGVTSECRECNFANSLNWSRSNPERLMLRNARTRARNAGVPFNLTKEDINIPSTCPVLGVPLVHSKDGKPKPNSPSLDRLVPSDGYVKNNVVVISYRANTIKNDATPEELRRVADWLEEQVNERRPSIPHG